MNFRHPFRVILATALLGLLFFHSQIASAHGHARPEKTGILLVAFGSSIPEAQVSFENIEAKVRKAFPGVPVRWAFTSHIIRHKLAREEGKVLLSTAEALAKMMDEGFTHVALQSLHTIPGEEYSDVLETARRFEHMPGGFAKASVGEPLLSRTQDIEATVESLLANIPAERGKNEAVVLMGHGTGHPANVYYAALQHYIWKKDPYVFVGTVEGAPTLEDVAAGLKSRRVAKAYLMPFMSVAGDHARNDMAGPEDDSWKSVLEKQGVACVPVLKGTAEYDNIVALWVAHLKDAMSKLD